MYRYLYIYIYIYIVFCRLRRRAVGIRGVHQAKSVAPGPIQTVRDPPQHRRVYALAAPGLGVRDSAGAYVVADDVACVWRGHHCRAVAVPRTPACEPARVVRVPGDDLSRGSRHGGTSRVCRRLMCGSTVVLWGQRKK